MAVNASKSGRYALIYYQKLFDARRALAFRGPGRAIAQIQFAEAAKLLRDRTTGLARIDAYRATVQIWNRLIDDPKLASRAADQFDVVLGIAQAFDAVKYWPDAQAVLSRGDEDRHLQLRRTSVRRNLAR
jgi:hypothetical protein